jgi:release factor glutamine methyltransferase
MLSSDRSSDAVPHARLVDELRAAGCVFAEDEAALLVGAATTPAELAALVTRRVSGEPLEYVLGWAEFCGLQVRVRGGVFVPRRRSELLVSEAVEAAWRAPEPATVVDLCCGSGALGAAVAAEMARRGRALRLYAVDIDPVAVRCALENIGADVGQVFVGDLYDALPAGLRGRVDVLMVNAPYVPTDAIALMPPEARLYEHRVALDGGADGLDLQRRVIAAAPSWLAPDGQLLIETSAGQAAQTSDVFAAAGLAPRVARDDDLDATVVVGARLEGADGPAS